MALAAEWKDGEKKCSENMGYETIFARTSDIVIDYSESFRPQKLNRRIEKMKYVFIISLCGEIQIFVKKELPNLASE